MKRLMLIIGLGIFVSFMPVFAQSDQGDWRIIEKKIHNTEEEISKLKKEFLTIDVKSIEARIEWLDLGINILDRESRKIKEEISVLIGVLEKTIEGGWEKWDEISKNLKEKETKNETLNKTLSKIEGLRVEFEQKLYALKEEEKKRKIIKEGRLPILYFGIGTLVKKEEKEKGTKTLVHSFSGEINIRVPTTTIKEWTSIGFGIEILPDSCPFFEFYYPIVKPIKNFLFGSWILMGATQFPSKTVFHIGASYESLHNKGSLWGKAFFSPDETIPDFQLGFAKTFF